MTQHSVNDYVLFNLHVYKIRYISFDGAGSDLIQV